MATKTIRYSKAGTTVIWKPDLCIHSGVCVRGLPEVFNPRQKPWVNMEGASPNAIVAQVARCPSGALTIETQATAENA